VSISGALWTGQWARWPKLQRQSINSFSNRQSMQRRGVETRKSRTIRIGSSIPSILYWLSNCLLSDSQSRPKRCESPSTIQPTCESDQRSGLPRFDTLLEQMATASSSEKSPLSSPSRSKYPERLSPLAGYGRTPNRLIVLPGGVSPAHPLRRMG